MRVSLLAFAFVTATDQGTQGEGDPPPQPGSGDGVTLACSEADSADNQDADGDGYSPCEGDCDDSDPAFHPDAPDIDDDRIDHNCDNWMPERT